MEELVKGVVEEFGHLVSVLGGTTDVPDPAPPVRFEQYESGFEHGYLTIRAAHDDDTDRLTDSRMALTRTVVLSASAPWSTAVGSGQNEYLPARAQIEQQRFPDIEIIRRLLGGTSAVESVPIPLDCSDGFVEAFYGRPESLLDPAVRAAQSAW